MSKIATSTIKILLVFALFFGMSTRAAGLEPKLVLPNKAPVKLEPYRTIEFKRINESSGLIKSRRWPNILWTHNDSGDEARLYSLSRHSRRSSLAPRLAPWHRCCSRARWRYRGCPFPGRRRSRQECWYRPRHRERRMHRPSRPRHRPGTAV